MKDCKLCLCVCVCVWPAHGLEWQTQWPLTDAKESQQSRHQHQKATSFWAAAVMWRQCQWQRTRVGKENGFFFLCSKQLLLWRIVQRHVQNVPFLQCLIITCFCHKKRRPWWTVSIRHWSACILSLNIVCMYVYIFKLTL